MSALKHSKFPMIAGIGTAILIGIALYASPYMTLNSMKGAIERGDSDAIAKNVDFSAVRASLKSEMRAVMTRQAQNDPMASLGSMMAGSLIDPLVDQMVTPEGLKILIDRSSLQGSSTDSDDPKVTMGYESLNSFVVEIKGKDLKLSSQLGASSASLLFSRSGFGWKLTGVRM
ncbi:MAG: DUF2939 domain-containing protein [Leptolyngbya sp. Prado105]|nr:DUF2939 domain-containing protein [Leptolyngbya sp. Prado105]